MSADPLDALIFAAMPEKLGRQQKVAMTIARVLMATDGDYTDQAIADRMETLVADGQLMAFGDLSRWRHAETARPSR